LLNLFNVYFTAALSLSGDTTDILIMKSFVERAEKSLSHFNCTFTQTDYSAYRSSLYLRNRQEFTSKRQPTRDWRAAITELHVQNAETSHNAIMKKVDDICFDLERRCYDIEGPVRSAEEERDRQKCEALQLKQQNEDLSRQLDLSTQTISTLQQDLARLEEHAGIATSRAEEQSEALELARQELRDQQLHSDDAVRAEQEKARGRELELIATSIEKDDQLEEVQESLRQLESQKKHLEQVVQASSHERATSAETTAELRHEITEVQALLQASKALYCQKEDEFKRLMAENNGLQMELGSVQARVGRPLSLAHIVFDSCSPELQMEVQAQETERLYSSLREAEEKAKYEILALTRNKEAELANLTSEVCHFWKSYWFESGKLC
jgi:chromosome segregation ATPase